MDNEINVKVNYVGFTRRTVAEVFDYIIFFFPLLILYIAVSGNNEIDNFHDEIEQLTSPYTIFTSMLYTVLEILMITRWGGTPGQLLCGIHIKDANTLENITLVQATVRYVLFEAFNVFVPGYIFALEEFYNKHNSEQWSEALLTLTFVVIILIFISAVFDRRKQFFYDKIARTVAIGYQPS